MTDIKAQKNNLDRLCDIYDLGDLSSAVYRDTDYRFGCLHLAEAMDDGNYPDVFDAPPAFMQSGWTQYYEIPMLLHPNKGALLIGIVSEPANTPAKLLNAAIEEEHTHLVFMEWKIRKRLETIGYWKNRPIVMGVGIVTPHHLSAQSRPANLAEALLIDRPALPHFARHVDALFAHYTTPAAQLVAEWGERLVTDITDSDEILGRFVGEDSYFERCDDYGLNLDGLVERAR